MSTGVGGDVGTGAAGAGAAGTADAAPEGADTDEGASLATVMAEIDQEVRRRRASGDLPARVERELDELFLQYSPVAGRGGGLGDALHLVDGAAYIDPVVPVGSEKSGGAVVKKGMRSLSLWYVGYITHQVSQFASAVSRALHLLDDEVTELRRQLEAQHVPSAPVLEVPALHGPDAWWVETAAEAVTGAPGRVLHAVAADGWLVRLLIGRGVEAYGVDPRPGRIERAEFDGTDLRDDDVLAHLRSVESAALGALVLTGVVDGMAAGERRQLLDLAADRLAPGGVLVVHSLSPSAWAGEQAPPEADLAPGRPLRPATWVTLLSGEGYEVTVHPGPEGADYLVVAALSSGSLTPR